MIRIRRLVKNKTEQGLEVPVLNDVTLSLPKQGLVVLSGSDCASKSDLLHVIAGLSEFDLGSVIVNDNDLGGMSERELDAFRNTDLGIIFRESKLRPKMTVYKNLELILNIQDWADKTPEETTDRIHAILRVVGLEGCENVPVSKLTEKERRLVLIARALVKDPKVVLADEPTANMDAIFSKEIMMILKWASKTSLVIIATENPDWAKEYADLELFTENGRFVKVEKNSADSIMPPDEFSESTVTEEKRIHIRDNRQELPLRYDVKARNLPFRDSCRLSGMFRKERKGLIFMLILAVLATLMTVYFNKNQPETLKAVITASYNANDREESVDLEKGPYYLDRVKTLAQSTGRELIPAIQSGASFAGVDVINIFRDDITLVALNEGQEDIYPVTQGHFPKNYAQIAITDFLAEELDVSIGDDINTILGRLTVCGIISTDHAKYGLTEKLDSEKYGDFTTYFLKSRYAIGAVRKGAFDVKGEYLNSLELPLFTQSDVYDATIGIVSRISKDQLIDGRMPRKLNEVLLSMRMAQMCGISWEIVEGSEEGLEFVDIHVLEYNEYYSEYLNLAEFFPEGISVVGLYSDKVFVDCLVEDEMFEKIRDRYMADYYFDEYLLDCRDVTDYGPLIKNAEDLGFRFSEPYADGVHTIKETIRSALPVVWCIAGFLGIFAIIILDIYLRSTIRENKGTFVDLRMLGVTKKDISKIFTVNALGIALICVILTALLSLGVMMTFNLIFASELKERYFSVLVWSAPLTLCLVAVAVMVIAMNWLIVKRKMRSFSREDR